ncbi:MAG: trypsin-like serine protease [Fimbriimonadaceae bacterium]|nr:MAG: trypsin-like serine protease [Fimbriimonadaceae bacterium]
MKKTLIMVLAFGIVAQSQAIVRRHDVADSNYLALGNVGASASVGLVFNGSLAGSATYIGFGNGAHWALTAGHVLDAGALTTFRINNTNFSLNGSFRPSDYNAGTLRSDVALVRFASNPGLTAVGMSMRSDIAGLTSMFAGYGLSGVGNNTNLISDNQRRAANNTIDTFQSFGTNQNFWRTTFQTPTQGGVLPLEGTTASGDSGGGFFFQEGSTWLLAGVTSWGTDNNSQYGDQAYFSTLHTNMDWITQTSGIQAVPEPTTMVLSGLALAWVARRRRNSA